MACTEPTRQGDLDLTDTGGSWEAGKVKKTLQTTDDYSVSLQVYGAPFYFNNPGAPISAYHGAGTQRRHGGPYALEVDIHRCKQGKQGEKCGDRLKLWARQRPPGRPAPCPVPSSFKGKSQTGSVLHTLKSLAAHYPLNFPTTMVRFILLKRIQSIWKFSARIHTSNLVHLHKPQFQMVTTGLSLITGLMCTGVWARHPAIHGTEREMTTMACLTGSSST
ncbi:hypothetical protein P7K49_002839 [Saguinus oedipus]|uniref:Uncharacterized protein n=1 Tax=Saguinus oedipus TaxID=9490 RepID=A0ABQ9WIG6_SAGOE|nr:hypothetical protein P7K49_002839 [Saguinus oedipus]